MYTFSNKQQKNSDFDQVTTDYNIQVFSSKIDLAIYFAMYHDLIKTYTTYYINCDHSLIVWTALKKTSPFLYQLLIQ